MSSQVIGPVLLVGMAFSVVVGLGLAAVGDLEGTRQPVAEAGHMAFDGDGDGRADGVRVFVHSPSPGAVRLQVYERGELVGETTARSWQAGPFAPCDVVERVLETVAVLDGVEKGAGSVRVPACWQAGGGSGGGGDGGGPCDPGDGCTTDPETVEAGCELVGIETVCLV